MNPPRPGNRITEALGAAIAILLCIAVILGLIGAIVLLIRWILG